MIVVGVDLSLHDGLGVVLGHLLDLHAALGGGDHRRRVPRAVHGDRKVELLVDVHAVGDQQTLHLETLGRSLGRDHAVGQHEFGRLARLFGNPGNRDGGAEVVTDNHHIDAGLDKRAQVICCYAWLLR